MSVENTIYLIDWQTFVSNWNDYKSEQFVIDALENEETWLTSFDTEWLESWAIMVDFADMFKIIEPLLDSSIKQPIIDFLSPFCLTNPSHAFMPIKDIDADVEDDWFFSNISPSTVSSFIDLYRKLDLVRLKEILSESADLFPQGHLQNQNDVINYIRELHRMLKAANTEEKGILILAA